MLQNSRSRPSLALMLFIFLCHRPTHLWADNFFKLDRVEYFQKIKKQEAVQEHLLDWREKIFNSDGKISYYEPPRPVLDLLNDPTPRTAQGYITWQQMKMEQINKAQQAVDALTKGKER